MLAFISSLHWTAFVAMYLFVGVVVTGMIIRFSELTLRTDDGDPPAGFIVLIWPIAFIIGAYAVLHMSAIKLGNLSFSRSPKPQEEEEYEIEATALETWQTWR